MQAKSSGWRAIQPLAPVPKPLSTHDRTDLFESARLCGKVLRLPAACRFVLDQLCAAYGGPVQGRALVWPSNEYLVERTGIAERTIRHALRRLIDLGVIRAKDSPNGKRFARRDRSGAIIEVFGFDLGPLLSRLSEFKDRQVQIETEKLERRGVFDAITIHRRSALEGLQTLARDFSSADARELTERAQRLSQALPRRSGNVIPLDAMRAWKDLHEEVEMRILSASGGKIDRHIDTNTKAPESPCHNRGEEEEATLVRETCRDAMEIIGVPVCDGDMVALGDRYRGMVGVSRDGWFGARAELGDVLAAKLLYHVIQMQARPRPGAQEIRNLGGYYRSMARMLASGAIDLDDEMRRRARS